MIDLEKEYDQLCAAISAIENGAQSYNAGGFSVTKANLATLYSRRRELQGMIAEQDGSSTHVAVFCDR